MITVNGMELQFSYMKCSNVHICLQTLVKALNSPCHWHLKKVKTPTGYGNNDKILLESLFMGHLVHRSTTVSRSTISL